MEFEKKQLFSKNFFEANVKLTDKKIELCKSL